MICIITVYLKDYMNIGIVVYGRHLKGSSAHWIHVVYTNTSMVQQSSSPIYSGHVPLCVLCKYVTRTHTPPLCVHLWLAL